MTTDEHAQASGLAQPAGTPVAELHLEVHPSVVFKLGADLVTDDVQALIELVKNCYDADSPDAVITVDTDVWTDPVTGAEVDPPPVAEKSAVEAPEQGAEEDSDEAADDSTESDETRDRPTSAAPGDRLAPVRGLIEIRDRGEGMTDDAIRAGWLTVSASHKREMKRLGQVTKGRKRTPLGDKGLGRLGAQRLGDILEIRTRPKGASQAHGLQIRWSDFDTAHSLGDVPLALVSVPGRTPVGTTLTIRGLRNPSRWRGEDGSELERELAAMISPFGDRGFDISLTIDNDPVDLRRRHEQVRDSALLRYTLGYADGVLTVEGRISTSYFRPNAKSELPAYQQLVENDHGARFREWLFAADPKEVATLGLSEGDDQYFIEAHRTFRLADLAQVRMESRSGQEAAEPIDPGPFHGEIDAVSLRLGEFDVFNSNADYRDFVSAINGVRIYRDGFAVRVDSDWLGLAGRWSSGTSFYNLRPDNVVGFIDITARDNAQLEELTNREGFQDTPAYQNFLLLMQAWRSFTENCQGFVRRRWLKYSKEQLAVREPSLPATPQAIKQRASRRRREVTQAVRDARRLEKTLDTALGKLTENRDESLFATGTEVAEAVGAAREARSAASTVTERLESLDQEYLAALTDLDVLVGQVDAMQEQLSDVWEAVSLGLTAEALTHEVHQIADRLRARSQRISRHLREATEPDLTILAYVEHVRSSAAALNRQASHLDPALRYLREQRTHLQASAVADSMASHYNESWSGQHILVRVDTVEDFYVEMNEGKLSQVLDNLILNAGYWIGEQRRRGHARSGEITIGVDAPCITVTDTGPGVDPAIEGLIFEPFVTTKGRGRGRGLGLFVVQQLLEPEGAQVSLDPATEADGRSRTFRLTFASTDRLDG